MRILAIALLLVPVAVAQRASDAVRPRAPDAPPAAERPVEIGLNDLFGLCRPESAEVLDTDVVYRTLGILRRTDALDAQGRFALVHPVAACCSDGIAIGLCVRTDRVAEFENGAQVILCGRLRAADPPPNLPRGHMAQVRLGIVRQHVEIAPTKIEVYDRLADRELPDLADKLDAPALATFARAVRAAGWEDTLRQPSYFTVLAPTEHAFGRLTVTEQRALFAPGNAERLQSLVRRHIVVGWKTKSDVMSEPSLATLGHDALPIELIDGSLRIGGARILFQDVSARNGIVLSLDRLLPEPAAPSAPSAGKTSDGSEQ